MPATLRDLQKNFVQALRGKAKGQRSFLRAIAVPLVGKRGASLQAERFGIYNYAYQARLAESLADDYATVQQILGEKKFLEFAKAYNATQKNRHFNLNEYGRNFLKWFAAQEPRPAYLVQAARLDWLVMESFYAAETREFKVFDGLKKIKLAPHVKLMRADWDVASLWNEKTDKLRIKKHTCVVVFRVNDRVSVRSIEASEFEILDKINKGYSLERIADTLAKTKKPSKMLTPEVLVRKFSEWKASGFFEKSF